MDAIDFFNSDILDLPKERDSDDFMGYVSKMMDEYRIQMQRVKNRTLVDKVITTRITLVHEVTVLLQDCLNAYFQGYPHQAYHMIDKVMAELGPHFDMLCPRMDMSGLINPMYRFRTAGDKPFDCKDLFHIPFESRHFVGPMRYSIPGLPCLYAGGSTYVCWRELRQPDLNTIWVSRVQAKPDTKLKVLNFGQRPTCFAAWIASRTDEFKDLNRNTAVLGAAVACWPLLALCSIRVRHDNGRFKPEYVVPQLVLQWITNKRRFHGVRYFSTHYSEYHDDPKSYMNYVFPASTVGVTGHCPDLSSLFELTEPMLWNSVKGESAPPAKRPVYKFHGKVLDDLEQDYGHVEDVLLNKPTQSI